MTIARELVTLLRYEIDDSNLRKFERNIPGGGRAPTNVPGLPTPAVINQTGGALGRLGGLLRGLIAGIGVVSIARISDEWAGVEGRVGLVTDGVKEQKVALDAIYALAQKTGQSYTAAAGLFQSVQRNGKELGLTLADSLKLTETISAAMTIGGGSAASQQAALTQLGQALGSGALRGDELNSIMEQSPRLAQAIAEAFGVSVGKLKDLGKEGKLTSKELAKGLLKQSAKLQEEFDRLPMTFARATNKLGNALGKQIDSLNKSTRAATIFYKAVSLVVDNLESILKYALLIGSAALFTKLAYAARALAASGGLFAKVLARFGGARAFGALLGTFARMLAISTALYYVFDDIAVWFAGGDSLLGDVIGPMANWKWLSDGVVTALTWVKNLLGDSASTVGQFVAKWGLIGTIIFGVVAVLGTIPTLIVGGIIAAASLFNYLSTNWESIRAQVIGVWDSITGAVLGAWQAIQTAAAAAWASIGAMIQAAVPEWARKGISLVAGAVGGPAAGAAASTLMGGSPAVPTRPGAAGGTTTVTNAPVVTVNATSSNPAAVADAASKGVQRGMGTALVPNVEASR